jgi:hypothetical protein
MLETVLYFILDLKVHQLTPPTFMFFVLKKNSLSSKAKKIQPERTLKLIFKQSWPEVLPAGRLNRKHFQIADLVYIKI